MLACMPRRSFQIFVSAYVTVVYVGAARPIGSRFRRLPPRIEACAHIGPIVEDLMARGARRGHTVVCRCLQSNALLMFKEGIDNIEKMPGELCVRARTTW